MTATQSGTRTAFATGEFGRFVGSEQDEVVLGHYRRHGTWAPELLQFLRARLAHGGTFIDVGANIGLVSIPLALKCPGVGVHALEPSPENHAHLLQNLKHHGPANVTPYPVAAFARTAELPFVPCAKNSGDHHLLQEAAVQEAAVQEGTEQAPGHVRVAARALDDLFDPETLPRPVVMKVDTQGAELQVLRGAQRLLGAVQDLVIEYWPAGLLRQGDSATQLRAALAGFPAAALLSQKSAQIPRLESTTAVLERLSFFRDDDPGFFDVWLSRETPPGPEPDATA